MLGNRTCHLQSRNQIESGIQENRRLEHNVQPEFEGRIASEIETAELPESWRKFLSL